MKRRICVVTGTRADYGLLRTLMQKLKGDPGLELQIIATGMHLSPEFGSTFREIEGDGFYIDRKVEMLVSSDTGVGVAKSMGLAFGGFADALSELAPHMVAVLGDRYEIFSAVATALVLRVPVAHLHGGELTEGAFDDSLRHSITKMSTLHFVATREYFNRVVQLGENPKRVHLVGGLGVDGIRNTKLLDREHLERDLDFSFGNRSLLVTFHPETLASAPAEEQLQALLDALDEFPHVNLIFTAPNSDTGGRKLLQMIKSYVGKRSAARLYSSMGHLRYLSSIQYVDGVVGNSSSGLLEVPTFKKGTVNIGARQRGRVLSESVINCEPEKAAIVSALHRLFSREFQDLLPDILSPYGEGGASHKVLELIRGFDYGDSGVKEFYDLPHEDVGGVL